MKKCSKTKSDRLLELYIRLRQGEVLGKPELSLWFDITERSVQRDIEHLKKFLADQGIPQKVIYDHALKGYRLVFINDLSQSPDFLPPLSDKSL